MAYFYVRKKDSGVLISKLKVSELKEMAKSGQLSPRDEINKEGHTTWHLASEIKGLEFIQENVTSVISLESPNDPSVQDTGDGKTNPLLSVKWRDGREDGPFELSSIKELASDGFILHDCTFMSNDEQNWVPFMLLNLQPKTDLYHISWTDGRKDGPFLISDLQLLVNDGIILKDCKFKKTKGTEIHSFNNMNLLDTSPSKTIQYENPDNHSNKVSVKEKSKKEKIKWRKGWFRRFVVKTTASFVIIALVIGLGCWGVWTAMPQSQREWAEQKYSDIRSNLESIRSSLESTRLESNILIPKNGPMWIHEELKMPVIGSFTPKNSRNSQTRSYDWQWSWTPQLLLAMPPNPVTQNIQLKAYYNANRFGQNEWFWFPDNLSVTRGIGRTNDNTPEYSDDSLRLLQLGDLLGIWNQTINKTSLVKSWFNLDIYNLNPLNDLYDLNNTNNYLSRIDDITDGIINRIELGGYNYWANTDYLQFKRDQKSRVVAIERFDSGGNSGGEIIRFEYTNDDSLVHFYTHNLYSGNEYWTDWTPTYSNGKLASLHGVDGKKEISAIYEYDSVNRIDTIHLNWNNEHYIASFAYLGANDYWSEATLTGKIVETNSYTNEESVVNDLGSIRYEQTVID